VLIISQLSKSFGERPVLQDINLAIPQGQIYGLLGANGAGKTTLINLICCLLTADRGEIRIDGQRAEVCARKVIGIVPQENLLYASLTCRENLQFFASLYGLRGVELRKSMQQCLAAVQLEERADSLVGTLSGGMMRRLSVAVALLHQPKLIVLDEPTTGLDIESRFEMWQLIQQLPSQGKTILLTTHLLEEAERLCDRLGILKQGRLIAEGTLAELRSDFGADQILLLCVTAEDIAKTLAIAAQHGFSHRRYFCAPANYTANGVCLAFGLTGEATLKEIVPLFAEVQFQAITLQPVCLEHIYLELQNPNLG